MNARTILIVEDDEDIRESLKDAFEDEGYTVQCAENGLKGLQILRHGDPPCIVVLDLKMPVMSGTELYNLMQSDPKLAGIPVLISTSDPSSAPSGTIMMKKPIDLQGMLTAVGKIC